MPRTRLTKEQQTQAEDNLRLVTTTLGRLKETLKATRTSWDDAFQAGAEGLCLAASRYDPARGSAFSSFATEYIRGYILTACGKNRIGSYRATNGRQRWSHHYVASLDKPIPISDNVVRLKDLIPDTSEPLEDAVTSVCSLDKYVEAVDKIGQRNKTHGAILRLRALNMTQDEIARAVGVSQGQVSRIINSELVRFKRLVDIG